jgi:hypothetical protein
VSGCSHIDVSVFEREMELSDVGIDQELSECVLLPSPQFMEHSLFLIPITLLL